MNSIKSMKETLRIIEGLTLFYQNTDKSLKTANFIIDEIYCIAHIHSSCKNLHIDWRKKRMAWKRDLKQASII